MTSHRQAAPDCERQLASLPVALILLAPGMTVAAANPAAEQFLGQSMRRLSGSLLTDVLMFEQPGLIDRLSEIATPVSAHDIAVQTPGGPSRRVDLSAAPVIDAPGWQLVTLHECSSEARGDEPSGGEQALWGAPEILAHEIRNPLAGIRGAAQLLARKLGDADRTLTDLIASEVDRIVSLIDEMQTLSRRTVAPVEPCNLHEAARRAAAILEAASPNAVPIVEEFDPSLPLVLGAPDALVQVVLNLLTNAQDACAGQTDARIVIRTRFASGLQLHATGSGAPVRLPVELRISDNGPGVPPSMRDHIFDPFVTTKPSGQGLGLALVRKLLREMNGRIAHERDEAAGWTHFRVQLPLAEDYAVRRKKKAMLP